MNLFRNNREGRPRAFWRLLTQYTLNAVGTAFLGSLTLAAFALFDGVTLGGETIGAPDTPPALTAAIGVASLVAALFSVWLAGHFFDHRPFSEFGLRLNREWWIELGFGLLLGALLMTGIFLVEFGAGWIRVTGAFETTNGEPFFPTVLAPVLYFLCVGVYEELISRGYQLTNLAEGLNFPSLGPTGAVILAWAVSSSLFGVLHLGNPNATPISSVVITFAGLLLGIGYVLTGRLAIPIGLHITWNLFQGNVFDFPVSGVEPMGVTFLSIEQGGPSLFTGGVFGPEAGLLGIAATLAGSLLIVLWVRARSGKANIETTIAEPSSQLAERKKNFDDAV